jgi:Acetyltransferase (GNAT) domain
MLRRAGKEARLALAPRESHISAGPRGAPHGRTGVAMWDVPEGGVEQVGLAARAPPRGPDALDFRVLDGASPGDVASWLALWRRWPGREVMAHPEYARLFARPCDRLVCVAGEGEQSGILFPLILRPIAAEPWARPGEWRWDAITPYGYGGPFAWGPEREEAAFWRGYAAFCRDEHVVSTFARLPLFPEQVARVPGKVEARAPNVVVPLSDGDALWRGYESRVRKWVRVAERAGLEVEIDREGARLDAFVAVYAHTMRRNGADDWYFFPRAFFDAIVEGLRGQFAFFHTLSRGEVVSSDLVLCSEEHVYYFLGGTLAEAYPLGPNYLLKHRIASWAMAEGKKSYVLGGGYDPEDGLLRYKRGYSRKGEVAFKVASMVHDEPAYRELVRDRSTCAASTGSSWTPRPAFFPSYRA